MAAEPVNPAPPLATDGQAAAALGLQDATEQAEGVSAKAGQEVKTVAPLTALPSAVQESADPAALHKGRATVCPKE